jgi:hypothetical protein
VRVLREVGKAAFLILTSFFGLAVLVAIHPYLGIIFAVPIAAIATVCLIVPQKRLWLDHRVVSIILIAVALFASGVSLKQIAEERMKQEQALRAKEQERLLTLRKTSPKLYLQELKAAGSADWLRELQALDPDGYGEYLKVEKQKQEDQRRADIETTLNQIKSTDLSDFKSLYFLYRRLTTLEPHVAEYGTKLKLYGKRMEEAEERDRMAKYPIQFVKVDDFSWAKEAFGNVMVANFSIKNSLPYPVKDVEVECTGSAPSGTVIDRNVRTIYQRIEAKSTKRIPNFNMGFINTQVSSTGCHITNVVAIR